MTKYILASASPRRIDILSRLGFEFRTQASELEDSMKSEVEGLNKEETVLKLSFVKASEVASKLILTLSDDERKDSYIVIGADTVVAVGDEILGKPKDKEDARRMIELLSGNSHKVITGVSLIYLPSKFLEKMDAARDENDYEELFNILERQTGKEIEKDKAVEELVKKISNDMEIKKISFVEETEVEVYPMKEAEIESYISTLEPYDKAGAYAIQGKFSKYIRGIRGDYTNVVGLPAGRLYQEIKEIFKNV